MKDTMDPQGGTDNSRNSWPLYARGMLLQLLRALLRFMLITS